MLTVLILLQSFKETISSVYYFSLVEMGLTPWIIALTIFLAPLLIGPLTKKLGWRNSYILLGAVMASSRLPMGFGLDQPFHLSFSLLSLASSTMMLSLLFAFHRRERTIDPDVFSSQSMTASFVIALMLMVSFRLAGSGMDITIVPKATGYLVSPALSGVISLGLGAMVYCQRKSQILDDTRKGDERPGYEVTGGASDSWMPALGLGAFLFVSTSVLTDPHVITAWIGEDFTTVSSFTIIIMGLFIFSLTSGMSWLTALRRGFSNPWGALIGNAILIGGAFNFFYIGINVGISPIAFTWIAMVDLWVVLDAITDSAPFAGEPMEIERRDGTWKTIGFPGSKKIRHSPWHFGVILTTVVGISFLLVLLVTYSLNWSFLPFGSIFKGGITVMMMLSVILLAIGGFSCSKGTMEEPAGNLQKSLMLERGSPAVAAGEGSGHLHTGDGRSRRLRNLFIAIGSVTMVIILMSGGFTFAFHSIKVDESGLDPGDMLTVVTYNIHHGFSNSGRMDPVPHLEVLKDLDPDIIFLQEADSLRIVEGNVDPGAYLANKLGMYYFRGAKPGLGNPGTGILSRFPLKDLEIIELRSDDISRIAVRCIADLGSKEVGLINVHFGLEENERKMQFEDLFSLISEMKNMTLIVGGDLNTHPDEEMIIPLDQESFGGGVQINRTTYDLRSAWHSTEEGWEDPSRPTFPAEGLDLEKEHIDYIMVTSDLEVMEAGIGSGKGASDHRPVWAKLRI